MSGYFGPRGEVWDEPADRTVFGLLRGHSDAEIARLIAPRPLVIETGHFPEYGFRLDQQGVPERVRKGAGKRGKPGRLLEPKGEEVRIEVGLIGNETVVLRSTDSAIQPESWRTLLEKIGVGVPANNLGKRDLWWAAIKPLQTGKDIARRHAEQVQAIDRHNQRVPENRHREHCVGSFAQVARTPRSKRERLLAPGASYAILKGHHH